MSDYDTDKTAVVFMADGMEMCECLLTVDILRRAKVCVITASVMGRTEIVTSHGVRLSADDLAENVDYSAADIIILPGGRTGTENLAASRTVTEQCRAFASDPGKRLAAICAAPSVPAGLGLLDGLKATCHPDFEKAVGRGGKVNITHESVTVDNNIITGQGLGATMDFALRITEELAGRESAEIIADAVCYRYMK